MPFALQLQESLLHRQSSIAEEFAAGDSLMEVLGRHLLAVEAAADSDMLTSILLLDDDGKRLRHGAAPSLPGSYCDAIDGIEIGPEVGSCGTAAFSGHPVYVTDIASDPLWVDFRDLALQHGLRACWSTPIRSEVGAMLGTFAIYHLTPRSPTTCEVEAIRMITGHVAEAILWARSRQGGDVDARPAECIHPAPIASLYGFDSEAAFRQRFLAYAEKLDRYAAMVDSKSLAQTLRATAENCRRLVGTSGDHPRNSLN